MGKYVIALDTDRIKQYVFATDALKEIRGASALFDELNREETERIVKANDAEYRTELHNVYANGGSAMFVISTEDRAKQIIQQVQETYKQKTITGSITGIFAQLPETWTALKDPCLETIKKIGLQLRMAKDSNPEFQSLVSHALLRTCDSCKREYAEKESKEEDTTALVCESCLKKRSKDQKIKKNIQDEIAHLRKHPEQQAPSTQRLWDRLLFGLKDQLADDRPGQFDDLGKMSSPSNYFALIYADGNSMGAALDKCASLQDIHDFSTSVDGAIYNAAIRALHQHPKLKAGDAFPFDVLLLGGDDLVIVTTAESAMRIATNIAKEFYTETGGKTLAVSVILAHAKYPFGALLSLAESALKFAKTGYAKKKRAGSKDAITGVINFLVVHSSNSLEFKGVYNTELQAFNKKSDTTTQIVTRTFRPYTLAEMEKLLKWVQGDLQDIPSTKLNQLREALTQDDPYKVMLNTFEALLRGKEPHKRILSNFVGDFAEGRTVEFPLIKEPDPLHEAYLTPLLDAIELYKFIEKGGRHEA